MRLDAVPAPSALKKGKTMTALRPKKTDLPPDDAYQKTLRGAVEKLAEKKRGERRQRSTPLRTPLQAAFDHHAYRCTACRLLVLCENGTRKPVHACC